MSRNGKQPILDLFITHWTEDWEIGRKGFEMLGLQRMIDWDDVRITLVHDGSEPFPEAYFEKIPARVEQVSIPHGGIAAARNWCIDHSEAKWIKWNDFDDMFAGIYSLKNIMDVLKPRSGADPDYEMLWFDVLAEHTKDGRVWLKDERDPVVLHGKVFNRLFLLDHGFRFQEDLTWCEDSAFLALIEMEINHQKIGKIKCEAPIYAWICRDGSLCNRPEVQFENLKSFFRRHCYVQEEFRKHGCMDEYHVMSARVLADSYFSLELSGIRGKFPEDEIRKHEDTVRAYYLEHRSDLLRIGKGMFQEVLDAVNRENKDCHITKDEFTAWLRSLRDGRTTE